jgi:predicted dehydrogenase
VNTLEKKLKFAIVGAGNIGQIHAQAIQAIPETELFGIYDNLATRAKDLAAKFFTQHIQSIDDLLNNPAIDVVAICTPSGFHAEIAVPAALHGKHILVEKPIEITLEKIDQIIAASQKAGVTLAGVFPSRFKIGSQLAFQAIQSGRLGKMLLVQGNIKWHRPDEYYRGSWRGTLAVDGGGALINQSIHTIDLFQWFGGPIKSIFGKIGTLRHQIEAEDTASALIEFENGAQGVIQGATSCWPGDLARIEIHGTNGTIILEEGRIIRWKLKDAAADEEAEMLRLDTEIKSGSHDPMDIGFELHRRQIADLSEAILKKRTPYVTGTEARKSVEIILAIYQSAKTGKPVSLPIN